jgi:DNA-binding protein YbaB
MSEFPALDRLEKLATEMAERSRTIEAMTDQLNEIEVTVEEAEGQVRVVAGSGGHVSRVELDPRAMRMGSDQLAEALTRACQRAVQEYEDRVMELMSPVMGGSGEVGDYLRRQMAEHKDGPAAEEEPAKPEPSQPSRPIWGDDDSQGGGGWGQQPATPPSPQPGQWGQPPAGPPGPQPGQWGQPPAGPPGPQPGTW